MFKKIQTRCGINSLLIKQVLYFIHYPIQKMPSYVHSSTSFSKFQTVRS